MQHYVYGLYKKNVEYKTYNLSEHLFYIGITSDKNLYFRSKAHKVEPSNPLKLNIINKYDFMIKILWSTKTRSEAEDREKFLIRWFGRLKDNGILANVLTGHGDMTHMPPSKSESTKKRISKALKKRNKDLDFRKLNRDRNLTVPYEEVILLIEEWAKNPLETQQSFTSRKNISRSMFKDWIRLYRPDYIGLTKKIQQQIFNSIKNRSLKRLKDIIQEFSNMSGLSLDKSKSICMRLKKRDTEL
jgi:hypothetical protein